jgi:hypothetical protein
MGSELLDHEVDCEETEGTTLAMPPVHKDCPLLPPRLLDEAEYCTNDALIDDRLDAVL